MSKRNVIIFQMLYRVESHIQSEYIDDSLLTQLIVVARVFHTQNCSITYGNNKANAVLVCGLFEKIIWIYTFKNIIIIDAMLVN